LQVKHEQRIAADAEFRFLKEDISEFSQQKSRKSISLNEVERRRERDAREAKLKDRESVRQQALAGGAQTTRATIQDDGLQANERNLNAELAAEKASKSAKDVFQVEAAAVLADELDLIHSSARLAQQVLSGLSRPK
jgi:carboxyl-terminal processing protease